jgi:hypothetical protein
MPAIGIVVAVGIGGIQQPDAGLECRANDCDTAFVIPIAAGRKAHASESEHGLQATVLVYGLPG